MNLRPLQVCRGQLEDRTASDLHQKQMEELGGDKDPCRASDQEADRQDPHGDQSQTGRLDLDHADVSGTDRDETRANQEADPESGGGVPSLLISGAEEQVPEPAEPQGPAGPKTPSQSRDPASLSLRGDCVSLASEVNVSRMSEDDDSTSVTASSVTSLFHRVQLDPLEKAWMRSSALGDAAAQGQLLGQESSLVLKKDFITTALHWAAKQGCQDAVDMMLRSGADVNVKSGYTPLHLASIHGHQRVVHALINVHNAKTNIRDYHGKVAAHYWSGPAHLFERPDLQPGGRKPGQRLVLPSLRLSRSRSQGQLGLDLSAGRDTWDLQMDVGRLTRKDIKEDSKVKIGHVLAGSRSQFAVQEIIGGGASCVVARCKNTRTKETVAAKIFPAELHSCVGQSEASTLRSIHSSEGVNHSLFVKCLDAFRHDGSDCLVLEMLALDLREALQVRQGKPLPLSDIRTIAKQLFMALADLKKLGILHANLKPDSVMLVDEEDLRIKIISFGLALLEHEATPGITIQAPGIRAPEIMLGLPFSYSVDMWGVGQILLFLYNPDTVWRRSSYQNMKHLVTLLGQPPEHMLDTGRHTSRYFQNVANASGFSWRLKRPDEYDEDTEESEEAPKCCKYSLMQLFTVAASSEETLAKDRLALLDLLKKIFCYEPSERIAPEEALQHDFITMRHLRTDDSSYLETSKYSYSGIIGEDAAEKANDSSQMEISFSPPKLAKTSSEGETLYWNETSDGMTSEEDSRSSEAPLSSNSSDAATSGRSRKPPLQTKAFFRRKVGKFFASRRIREDLCCCLQPSHED